jgi:hypothetical protein
MYGFRGAESVESRANVFQQMRGHQSYIRILPVTMEDTADFIRCVNALLNESF